MSKINIVIINPLGYKHSLAFLELKEFIASKLLLLNYEVDYSENILKHDCINIILGAHLLDNDIFAKQKVIVVNTEQLGARRSPWLSETYKKILNNNYVWDYSYANKPFILHENISIFSLTYDSGLDRLKKNVDKDIDILFYGQLNKRRLKIIDHLRHKGLHVEVLQGAYSIERDKYIERSKFVLNLHFYDTKVLQQVRVFYPLCNGIPVLSENYPKTSAPDFYNQYIFTPNNQKLSDFVEDQVLNYEKNKESILFKLKGFRKTNLLSDLDICISDAEKFFSGQSSIVLENPKLDPAYLRAEIKTLMVENNFIAALVLIKSLLELEPKDSKALANLSVIQSFNCYFEDAVESLEKAIHFQPDFESAYVNLSQIKYKLGQSDQCLRIIESGLSLCSEKKVLYFVQGNLYNELGNFSCALDSYSQCLKIEPNFKDALWNRALLCEKIQDYQSAKQDLDTLCTMHGHFIDVYCMLVSLCSKLNDNESITTLSQNIVTHKYFDSDDIVKFCESLIDHCFFRDAINLLLQHSILGNSGYVLYLIANCYVGINDIRRAQSYFNLSIQKDDSFIPALVNFGNLYLEAGKFQEAKVYLLKAYSLNTEDHHVIFALANLYFGLKDYTQARSYYNQCLSSDEFQTFSIFRIGCTYLHENNYLLAIDFFESTHKIDPSYADPLYNLGITYTRLANFAESRKYLEKALLVSPKTLLANLQLGHISYLEGDIINAIHYYKKELELNPSSSYARLHQNFCEQQLCIWDNFSDNVEWLESLCWEPYGACAPWQSLTFTDNPEIEKQVAKAYATEQCLNLTSKGHFSKTSFKNNRRLRVGFLSSDFYEHATMHLLGSLFSEIDHTKIEIFIFDYSQKNDTVTTRLSTSVPNYFRITLLNDIEAVSLIKSKKLDIAIDLKGFTRDSRNNLFLQRIASIHISFLGYPGTSGCNLYDFILADSTVIPQSHEKFYTESVLRMPFCYQPNDFSRKISSYALKLEDYGLPHDKFVFCSFNANYKITPREFAIWMRILAETNSIMWILKTTAHYLVEDNLRAEAAAHGIDPTRLFFCDKCDLSVHLARHKLAQLHLDTFNVNAHTTASDSLYAGLPILTRIGDTFSSRVCASILKSANMEQFIAYSDDEYFEKAVFFANNPGFLKAATKELFANRQSMPLFDIKKYARSFEDTLLSLF